MNKKQVIAYAVTVAGIIAILGFTEKGFAGVVSYLLGILIGGVLGYFFSLLIEKL